MRATAQNIWQVPAYLPYVQPSLTDEAIAAAERKIGYKLPAEFLDLLRVQNGGYIRYSLPDSVHEIIAGIGPYFPSLTDFDWDDVQEYVSCPLQGLVPFDGDGHWHLCLDYRRNANRPSVAYIDVECDACEANAPIAESFAEYLGLLRIDPDNSASTLVLENVSDLEALKAALAVSLGVEFYETGTYDHGYETHRGRMETKDNPEWIWLTPNLVARGFVRPDDDRYAELKDSMPGKAPRYPELPPDSYMLGATEAIRPRVLDAFSRLGFRVRSLRTFLDID